MDHVFPKIIGGGNRDNIVKCCLECNSNKASFLLTEWETRLMNPKWVALMPNPDFRTRVNIILVNIRIHPLYSKTDYSIPDDKIKARIAELKSIVSLSQSKIF